ncbi:hypothetical protein LCGC14_2602030 [marine sediment metagenome]|uniref:Uncharacterized protein n=1 Tax=marine sediment metagenome TaxID=412755 RepID=A0A0F9D167_9ZZZZ
MFHHFLTQTIDIPNSTFKIFDGVSGVDNLDPNLTINGTTVTPTFRYNGKDANGTDWAPWTYGETLDWVSNGTNISFNQGSPLLGSNDDSVLSGVITITLRILLLEILPQKTLFWN